MYLFSMPAGGLQADYLCKPLESYWHQGYTLSFASHVRFQKLALEATHIAKTAQVYFSRWSSR